MKSYARFFPLWILAFVLLCFSNADVVSAKSPSFVQTGSTTSSVVVTFSEKLSDYEIALTSASDGHFVLDYQSIYNAFSQTITIRGLEAGSTYYLYVSTNGDEAEVIPVITSPDATTAADSSLSLIGVTSSEVSLSWNPVEGANCYAVVYTTSEDNHSSVYTEVSLTNEVTLPLLAFGCQVKATVYPLNMITVSAMDYTYCTTPEIGNACASSADMVICTLSDNVRINSYKNDIDNDTLTFGVNAKKQYVEGISYRCVSATSNEVLFKNEAALSTSSSFKFKVAYNALPRWSYLQLRSYVTLSNGQKVYSDWSDKYYFSSSNQSGYTFTSDGLIYQISALSANGRTGQMTCLGPVSTEITSVKIPATVVVGPTTFTVNAIGDSAFSGCSSLKKIVFNTKKIKKIGTNAFSDISSKATIYIPKKKKAAYTKLLTASQIADTTTIEIQ